ncbi:helix-turn-helix domain-containing protein [Desulfovibrio falkowii]|uniref:XRE family transcriptional regulator n=1 Tax=Desulfovibrio falkowii TaxID=3136602 RepID=A0ABQ0E8J7_9BACT
MQQAIPINPALLQWARIEAGLSLQEAAERAKVPSPRQKKGEERVSPEERLASWEQGIDVPSLSQLESIADAYRRPILTFFLPESPIQIETLADFRTTHESSFTTDTPEFSALKRRIILLHRELKTLADDEGNTPLPFVGSYDPSSGVDTFVNAIREVLGVSFEDQQRQPAEDKLLGYLRDLTHDAGIYVVLMGDVGSHHSKIEPDEFRGISVADPIAPLVVINKYDAKPAMLFTLIHELAHIWMGASGVSNLNGLGANGNSSDVERFCNAVAAEFLVPEIQIRAAWKNPEGSLQQAVDELAKKFKVSGAVVGRRLLDAGIINRQEYGALLTTYQRRWESVRNKNKTGRGPDPNRLAGYYLGKKTINTFIHAANSGRITLQDAARVLNIPVSRFDKVVQ